MFRELLCLATRQRYHYRARLEYRTPDNKILMTMTFTLLVNNPKHSDDHRKIKKDIGPELIEKITRHRLCNGHLVYEPIAYLGLFKKSC